MVMLSWLVTVLTILVFMLSIIPEEKRSLMQSLESKAQVAATSIANVAAGGIVVGD